MELTSVYDESMTYDDYLNEVSKKTCSLHGMLAIVANDCTEGENLACESIIHDELAGVDQKRTNMKIENNLLRVPAMANLNLLRRVFNLLEK
jgi:hypothetical protein